MENKNSISPGGEEEVQKDFDFSQFGISQFGDLADRNANKRDFHNYINDISALGHTPSATEIFIRPENCLEVFLPDSPSMNRLKEWVDTRRPASLPPAVFKELISFFDTWYRASDPERKSNYAQGVLKDVENQIKDHNFLEYLLSGLIYTYDPTLRSQNKAYTFLGRAMDKLGMLFTDVNLKDEFMYLTQLNQAFANMHFGDNSGANHIFTQLGRENPNATTAMFYDAYTQIRMLDVAGADKLILKLLSVDKLKLETALKHNSFRLLNTFVKYAFTYQFFLVPGFEPAGRDISLMIRRFQKTNNSIFKKLRGYMDKLDEAGVPAKLGAETKKEYKFFRDVADNYGEERNKLLLYIADDVSSKFHKFIERVKNSIIEQYKAEINGKAGRGKKDVNTTEGEIDMLKEDLARQRKITNRKIDEYKDRMNSWADEQYKAVKQKLDNIDNSDEFDKKKKFKRMMATNVLITLAMLVVGGLLEVFGNVAEYNTEFPHVILPVIKTGAKYAALIFFLGLLASVYSAMTAKRELAKEKIRLRNMMKNVKLRQEADYKKYRAELEEKMIDYENAINQRIESLKSKLKKENKDEDKTELTEREKLVKERDEMLKKIDDAVGSAKVKV